MVVQRMVPDAFLTVTVDPESAVPVRVSAPVEAGDGRGEIVGVEGGVVSVVKDRV
jgi:hypothetical protein